MTRLPALLFDLDGTLVDTAQGIAEALSLLSLARGGDPVDAGRVRSLVNLGVEVLVCRSLGDLATDSGRDVSEFRTILASIPADPACVFTGVQATLRQLASRGHRMAVVTNKPEKLSRQLLSQVNLDQFFETVVGGDSVAKRKPDPAPLHHALQFLGVDEDGAILIGDSDLDAIAADAAGVKFGLFLSGYGSAGCARHQVSFEFDDFEILVGEEFPHLLGESEQLQIGSNSLSQRITAL